MVHANFKLADPSLLRTKGWINDKEVSAISGRKPFDVVDPGSGEVWTTAEEMDEKDTDAAVAAAAAAFPAFSAIPARQRGRMILKLDQLVRENKEDLAQLLTLETGKALAEARGEIDYAASYSWLMAGEAERITGDTLKAADVPNQRFFTQRVPVGPVGLLVPWNFPIVITLRKMVSALAAGCTMVIKPSPETPATALALAQLAKRAGFAPGVINVVTASNETTPAVGKALCEDKRIKKISFTGSTNVGKLLFSQSASTLKKLTLELGGNGGWVVFEDADLERAAESVLANKFRNAGQVCVCANRVFVHRSVQEKFVSLVAEKTAALKFGHGLDEGSTNGSVTTQRGVERAVQLIEDAVGAHGAKIVTGGQRFGTGYHLQPTILTGADKEARVYKEEMFAPIISVYAFDTEEEVTALVNNTDMGLTNYVWTTNITRAWRMFEALESGTVAINTVQASHAEAPFGGIKESGIGKEGGFGYGVNEFTVMKLAALTLW